MVVIFDSHWFTTGYHLVDGSDRYSGTYISDEMPWYLHGVPYDYRGHPALAPGIEAVSRELGGYNRAIRHPDLGRQYATINLVKQLRLEHSRTFRWSRVSSCQNCRLAALPRFRCGHRRGDPAQRPAGGAAGLGRAEPQVQRHRLEAEAPAHLPREQRLAAREHRQRQGRDRAASSKAGTTRSSNAGTSEYRTLPWEAFGAHYLQMVGAMGGAACRARRDLVGLRKRAWHRQHPHLVRRRATFVSLMRSAGAPANVGTQLAMNFEFPFKELPAVMRGPRIERRRVLIGGQRVLGHDGRDGEQAGRCAWTTAALVDAGEGELPAAGDAEQDHRGAHLVQLAQHRNAQQTQAHRDADLLHQAAHLAERARRPDPQAGRLQVPQLRGRVRGGHRPHLPQCDTRRSLGLHRRLLPGAGHGSAGLPRYRPGHRCCASKGADTLLPIGPGIVRGVNLFEQTLRTYVDGLVVQEARIGDETIWGPHYVIADIARHITLVPGDVILMGTPCHSRSVDPGHVVECEITGIGRVARHRGGRSMHHAPLRWALAMRRPIRRRCAAWRSDSTNACRKCSRKICERVGKRRCNLLSPPRR